MKRILSTVIFALLMIVPLIAFGQEAEKTKPIWDHGNNVSDITYVNANILKIYDQRESYVVLYEKPGLGTGKAVVPKKWYKEHKIVFRKKEGTLASYMTVLYKNNEFYKVYLTVPVSKNDPVWGFVPNNVDVQGTDADTLEFSLK